jgi:hypothetical protein
MTTKGTDWGTRAMFALWFLVDLPIAVWLTWALVTGRIR